MGFLQKVGDAITGEKTAEGGLSSLVTGDTQPAEPTPPETPTPETTPPAAPAETQPAPPSFQDLASQGKIPNLPEVFDAIKNGKVTLEDVMQRHADMKKKVLSGELKVSDEDRRIIMNDPQEKPQNPSQDQVLQDLVSKDEIPAIPEVLDAIKSGKVSLETVMERHKQIKAQYPNMTGDKDGNLTVNPNGDQAQNAPAPTGETIVDPVTGKAVPKQTVGGLVGKAIDKSKELINKDNEFYQQNSKLPMGEAIQNQLKRDVSSMAYISKKYASGLSFGVYDPEMEAPGFEAAAIGAMASLGGNLVSGMLGGAALKAIPIVGPALGALEESASKSIGFAKHAKAVAGIVAEAAPIGFVAGAAKSTLHGNKFADVMADGLIDAGVFAAGGVVLYPLAEAAGSVFAKAKVRRANAAGELAIKEGKSIAEAAAAPVEGVSAEGKPVSRAEMVMENINKIPVESRTPDQNKLLSALERIRATQPVSGPFQASELVKDPEALRGLLGEDAKATVQGLFMDQNAPLKSIYDSNPSIKSMVDSGNYIDALQSVQGAFREQVKDYKTVGDIVAAPFMNNAESVYNVVADRVLGRADPIKYPRLNRNLIINYFNEGTDTAKQALLEAVPNGQKRILDREVFGKFQDVRLTPNEADKLVGDVLQTHMEAIKNGGTVSFENLGKLKDTNSILKAAITFNKNISQTMIQSYREGYGHFHDSFIRAPEDLQAGIRDEINIRRILAEKSDEVARVREMKGHMAETQAEYKSSTDPAKREALKEKLDTMRIDLKDSSTNLFNMRRALNEASTAIDSLHPEKQAQVRGFVDQVWLPTKKQLNVSGTTDYLNRFDYKDNPLYIKNGSALSDHMNAMTVGGKDIDIPLGNSFQAPFGINIENLTQKMNKEFGPNNPIEQFFRQIKERDAAIKVTKEAYYDRIREMGIKEGTKESALLHRFAEKRLLTTDQEFLALPPKDQNMLIENAPKLRSIYDELIDAHNDMARANNIPEVAKRADYVTHYKETQSLLPQFLESFSSGSKEAINPFDNRPFNISMASRNGDPSKPFFRWEIKRSGGEFVEDAVGSIKRYIQPSLERIFYTDLVREADAARAFAPNNMGKLFDHIKRDYLLKIPNEIESGGYGKGTSKAFKATLNAFTSKMAEGQLLYKVNTVVQQVTSMALNFSGGGREAIAAATKMFTAEGERRWGMSLNGALRDAVEGNDLDARLFKGLLKDWNGSKVAQNAKVGFDYFKKFGRASLEIFDRVAAKHAYLTGFEKAVKGGMTEQQASVYADKWIDAIHNSLAHIDRPDNMLQNSTIGKSLLQFQSYSINLAATLMNDLPNAIFHDGSAKAITSLLRAGAAISITNEGFRDIGLPAPFSIKEFVPLMSTYRFGAPGYWAAIKEVAKTIGGPDRNKGQLIKEVGSLATGLAIPGGGQVFNVVQARMEKKKGKIMRKDLLKAELFGPSAIKRAKEQKADEKVAERKNPIFGIGKYGVGPTRVKAREFIKKNIFRQ